jgi:pyruvate dehydrogenase E2 component (dihydrolipoamide acetyltransferase)
MDVMMKMPDLATTGSAMTVVRWFVEAGQSVRRGQPLLEVETDKAVMEVESVVTGTLATIRVPAGAQVEAGQVIAVFDSPDAASPAASARAEPAQLTAPSGAPRSQIATPARPASLFARNRAARQARNGASAPSRRAIPLSAVARTAARRVRESKQSVPHFYLQTSANAESLAARRVARPGKKVVWDAFFIHAAGKALQRFDRMCTRFEDDHLHPQEVDAVGFAIDLEGELFTAAIEHPAEKDPEAISDEIVGLLERLRAGDPEARRLRKANMTISNLGGTHVESFAAIINPPESAVLAVGKVMRQAVPVDGKIGIQQRVALTLSVDHRVVSGKYAADFLGAIVQELESL